MALASVGSNLEAVGLLRAAQYGKRLLLLKAAADRARIVQGHGAEFEAYRILADLQHTAPHAVEMVVRHPAVGARLQHAYRVLTDGGRGRASWLPPLAAAAVVRARAAVDLDLPAEDGKILLPSLGRAEVRGDSGRLCRIGGGVRIGEVRLPDDFRTVASGWTPLPSISEAPGILMDDLDPYRLPGADIVENRPSDISRWSYLFGRGWALLTAHHPDVAAEVRALITTVTPLEGKPGTDSKSATSARAFGGIGLSLPKEGRRFAVCLAHEVQHTKLFALTDMVRLTRSDDGRLYYAPWRDDPRPAYALLHGVYAHLGVAGFWRRQREVDSEEADALEAHIEFARWRDATAHGIRTLLTADCLTAEGTAFVQNLSLIVHEWQDEAVPMDAARAAREAARAHRARHPLGTTQRS